MPFCFKATRDLLKTCAAVATLGVALAPSNALAVTTWNWAFNTNPSSPSTSFSGSGTWTTADVTPAANTTYTITGISGTFNHLGTPSPITGLDPSGVNIFTWEGPNSRMLVSSVGVKFYYGSSSSAALRGLNVLFLVSSFNPNNDRLVSGNLTSNSSVAPVSTPTSAVPGPLPLLGAAAAFQASRRLRRRLSGSLPAA